MLDEERLKGVGDSESDRTASICAASKTRLIHSLPPYLPESNGRVDELCLVHISVRSAIQ